jgi:PAS domain S-box-containing protein
MPLTSRILNVLVIEDNPGDFVLVEEYLHEKFSDPNVTKSETFSDASKLLDHSKTYDVILLDLSLPDKSGEPLVKEICAIADPIPVIVLTGYENQDFGLKTLSLGVSDYLLKDELTPFVLGKSINYSIERNRISSSLKKSEQDYQDLFNFSPQPMWVYDVDSFKFLAVNQAAIHHYGYSREEFLSMKLYDIRPEEEIPKLEEIIRRSKENHQNSYETVFLHKKKDGTVIHVNVKSRVIMYNGKIADLVLANDITSKLEAERELQQSEQRFRSLVQDSGDLIGILDENTFYTYVAPNSKSILGIPADHFIGKNVSEFIHPDDLPRIEKIIDTIKNQERFEIEPFRFRDGSGKWRWIETVITNSLDNPAINGYVVNSRDVTRQQEREEKLKELSLVASKTTDVVVITDADENITWVNRAFEELTEYTLSEVEGKIPGDFLQGPDSNEETIATFRKAIDKHESVSSIILNYTKSGNPYWLEVNIDPILDESGNCTHFIAIERDVTDKIEKEITLRESLERYDIVSKATSDTIWDMDLATGTMQYNNNIHNMFGFSVDEVENISDWWRNHIHPDDRAYVNQMFRKAITDRTERFQLDYRFRSQDGSYKYIFDRAFVMKDESGDPTRIIGAMQDITQEVEEQERLKLLESVITNSNDSVVISEGEPSDGPGREIIFVNNAFTKLTGYTKKDVEGHTLEILNGPETDRNKLALLGEQMNQKEISRMELLNYKKSGEKFWISLSSVPVFDNQNNCTHWVTIGRNVTEEKRQEKILKDSLKEKETLLAEIHHRVKNNLAIVSSLMQMQAMNSDSEDLNRQLLESVLRIKSMAGIHEQLYQANDFARLQFSDSLKNLTRNVIDTLQTDTDIELNLEIEPIELNINQSVPCSLLMNEVITNILKHGFKGREKGVIQLKSHEVEENVSIQVVDDGVGLPDNFESMKNSSLGLELIELLTEQLEGENRYYSNGNGTVFELRFKKTDIKGSASAFID